MFSTATGNHDQLFLGLFGDGHRDQKPFAIGHHDDEPFILPAGHDAAGHVHGLALPERKLLQPEVLPLRNLRLVARAAGDRHRLAIRGARLHAHPSRVVPDAVPGDDEEREPPRHLVGRAGAAEPVAGLVDAGPGERAVVGRPGGSEEHGLGAAADDGEGVERDGLDAAGHGVGAAEVARVLHHRDGGGLVLRLQRRVRARPGEEEPRQRQRVAQHQAAAHAHGVSPVALEPCQLHAAENSASE